MISANRLPDVTPETHPTPLPTAWYCDPAVLELERRMLFANGPGYVGHELMVPAVGDYHVPAGTGGGEVLVRDEHQIRLLSNVCRHRQALMLDGAGTNRRITCPLHRWSYRLDGDLIAAPHFDNAPQCRLPETALQRWNGMLFRDRGAAGRTVSDDLADLPGADRFDLSSYLFDRVEVTDYDVNWKTFIEVYAEDYHVNPFHPGLSSLIDCAGLSWEFGPRWSIQTVESRGELRRTGSPSYTRYQEAVFTLTDGAQPAGVTWLLYAPNVMIEYYPFACVISTVEPLDVHRTRNVVEFYFPAEVSRNHRGLADAYHAAYVETAEEDDEIARRMDTGRRALYAAGLDNVGPYQSPLEDGVAHFHRWITAELGPAISEAAAPVGTPRPSPAPGRTSLDR